MTNVSRIVALGSSKCRNLQRLGAPGTPDSNGVMNGYEPGWVPFKTLARASSEVWRVWRLEVTNVSRIVSLGGSIYRILRVSEALGTPVTNRLESLGGSPLKPLLARVFGGLESL